MTEQETDLVPHEPALLLAARTPEELVKKATAMANVLQKVIADGNLFTMIGSKKHVQVEGWTTLGAMVGVFPIIEWTREIVGSDGDYLGWEARCTAQRPDGAIIGAAEAECRTAEKRWGSAESYAVRSMAQTRATSKAMRLPLAWVMTLAGFDATPAEEMSDTRRTTNGPAARAYEEPPHPADDTPQPPVVTVNGDGITRPQTGKIRAMLGKAFPNDEQAQFDWVERVQPSAVQGTAVSLGKLTKVQASAMIEELSALVD